MTQTLTPNSPRNVSKVYIQFLLTPHLRGHSAKLKWHKVRRSTYSWYISSIRDQIGCRKERDWLSLLALSTWGLKLLPFQFFRGTVPRSSLIGYENKKSSGSIVSWPPLPHPQGSMLFSLSTLHGSILWDASLEYFCAHNQELHSNINMVYL